MAKKIPLYFIKQYVFWFLFFVLNRTVFFVYNYDKLVNVKISEFFSAYWHALYLDNSTACYIMILPFILLFFQSIIKIKWNFINILNKYYSYIIIIIIAIITSGELGLYDEWKVKLNYKAISYLSHPSEAFNSAKTGVIIIGIILIIVQSAVGIYFYQKFIHQKFYLKKRSYISSVLFLLITPVLIGLGIRGGVQQIPINQSDVYFSKNNFLNTAAVNSAWNFMNSIEKNKEFMDTNPFNYYNIDEARASVDSLHYIKKDTCIKILNTKRPNIVLILLESWAGDLVYSLGGYQSITPEFEKLIDNGLLFTNNYANGTLSHHAIASILSGFPATPVTSITKQPSKFQKLPCFAEKLKNAGYHTSFHFGGQLNYGNIKGFIYFNQFDHIIEGKDFPNSVPTGKLGVPDEYFFDRHIRDINSYPQPFFAAAFTLSSHSPYDEPMKEVLHWGGEEKDFINSVYYTDKCIGKYIEEAKKQKWYNNTLFIFVADHSHNTPKNRDRHSKPFYKIPMLFYGKVLKNKYKGKKYTDVSSQIDIAATLLAQLNITHKEFEWSKDLFNPYSPKFAYCAFDDGLVWITKHNYFVYDHNLNKISYKQFESEEKGKKIIKTGKSYLQLSFQEYLDY